MKTAHAVCIFMECWHACVWISWPSSLSKQLGLIFSLVHLKSYRISFVFLLSYTADLFFSQYLLFWGGVLSLDVFDDHNKLDLQKHMVENKSRMFCVRSFFSAYFLFWMNVNVANHNVYIFMTLSCHSLCLSTVWIILPVLPHGLSCVVVCIKTCIPRALFNWIMFSHIRRTIWMWRSHRLCGVGRGCHGTLVGDCSPIGLCSGSCLWTYYKWIAWTTETIFASEMLSLSPPTKP